MLLKANERFEIKSLGENTKLTVSIGNVSYTKDVPNSCLKDTDTVGRALERMFTELQRIIHDAS